MNYLKYFSLIAAIPNSWKYMLNAYGAHNLDIPNEPDHIWLKLGVKEGETKTCKAIYRKLLSSGESELQNLVSRWNTNFPALDGITIQMSFKNVYHITTSCELQYFQFKLLHRIVVTNEKLYMWNIVESDICTFCMEEIETMFHLFF